MPPPGALQIGPRVYIRRLAASDEEAFLAFARASRPLHHPWVHPPTTSAAFAKYLARAGREDACAMLILRRDTDAICGGATLSQIFYGSFENAYLGYSGSRATAGKGYMTEGLHCVLRHAFVGLKLHRVEANIQPGNTGSRALAKRCGFRLEGFSPRYLKVAGQWRDHERWAITREDWRALPDKPRIVAGPK